MHEGQDNRLHLPAVVPDGHLAGTGIGRGVLLKDEYHSPAGQRLGFHEGNPVLRGRFHFYGKLRIIGDLNFIGPAFLRNLRHVSNLNDLLFRLDEGQCNRFDLPALVLDGHFPRPGIGFFILREDEHELSAGQRLRLHEGDPGLGGLFHLDGELGIIRNLDLIGSPFGRNLRHIPHFDDFFLLLDEGQDDRRHFPAFVPDGHLAGAGIRCFVGLEEEYQAPARQGLRFHELDPFLRGRFHFYGKLRIILDLHLVGTSFGCDSRDIPDFDDLLFLLDEGQCNRFDLPALVLDRHFSRPRIGLDVFCNVKNQFSAGQGLGFHEGNPGLGIRLHFYGKIRIVLDGHFEDPAFGGYFRDIAHHYGVPGRLMEFYA